MMRSPTIQRVSQRIILVALTAMLKAGNGTYILLLYGPVLTRHNSSLHAIHNTDFFVRSPPDLRFANRHAADAGNGLTIK